MQPAGEKSVGQQTDWRQAVCGRSHFTRTQVISHRLLILSRVFTSQLCHLSSDWRIVN